MSAESRITVGLLHPGEMGAAVGATVVAGGMPCLWASAARSAATRARAREVGLEDAGTLEAVVRASRVILSVVPPHGAADLARAVAALGFRGLYVDANAVAPATAREMGRVVEAAGARFVDGGIIGPATRTRRGVTRVYLAGPGATEVAALFRAGPLEAVVLDALALRGRDGRDRSLARRGGAAPGLPRGCPGDLRAARRLQGHDDVAHGGGSRRQAPRAAPTFDGQTRCMTPPLPSVPDQTSGRLRIRLRNREGRADRDRDGFTGSVHVARDGTGQVDEDDRFVAWP